MTDPAPVRPWWAALLTSALTTLFGLILIALSVVLVRPALSPDESWIWIALLFGGAGLAGVGGSLVRSGAPPPDQRGNVRVAVLFGIVALIGAVALTAILPGCASTERNGETLGYRLRDDPERPPPACLYHFTVDGELVVEGAIDECPAVPVCSEPK